MKWPPVIHLFPSVEEGASSCRFGGDAGITLLRRAGWLLSTGWQAQPCFEEVPCYTKGQQLICISAWSWRLIILCRFLMYSGKINMISTSTLYGKLFSTFILSQWQSVGLAYQLIQHFFRMLKWEDNMRSHPYYIHAVVATAQVSLWRVYMSTIF